jgi:hypothetical protein
VSIVIQVNGSSAGDGFLIAPDNGINFTVPLNLSTDDGSTVSATIDATPNGGGVALPAGSISIGPSGVTIPIFATAVSGARGDTIINVNVGAVTTSFTLTAISNPVIGFRGRFEARFATDNDYYNNPRGTDGTGTDGSGIPPGGTMGSLAVPGEGPGWTWALDGEPDFVPKGPVANSIPNPIDTPVGRVMRFNNPIALRTFAAPVATTVNEISGSTTAGTEVFTAGDPVFGATVNLGPNTYLAANWPKSPSDPWPAEPPPDPMDPTQPMNIEGNEPMNLFEVHIDGFFSGKSATLADRPTASGFTSPLDAAEKAIPQFINPATATAQTFFDLATFNAGRLAQLQNAYQGLSPAAQAGPVGQNLQTRINHINPSAAHPTLATGWDGKEEYTGQVNDSVTFQPNTSSVVAYFAGYTAFTYFSKHFTFHSDELNGYVHGSLTANAADRLVKTFSLQLQNSTFGKDQLTSKGLPTTFPSAFWVVMNGFFPSELGIDATDNLTNPPNPPTVTFSVDPTNANLAAIVNALQTLGQLVIEPFAGPVLTTTLPPPNAPQRILYPFTIQFTGTDGFIDQTESLTLTATITVNGKTYSSSAPLVLTTAANPYVTDADAGNQYTSWLSTDLRVFSVDDDTSFFGKTVGQFYPPGAVAASYPVSAAAASTAATAYIADLIQRLTPSGAAGGDSFENSLTELEDATGDQLEFLQQNPRTGKAAFNFAICRVRIQGTTPPPPPPFTTQARNCRVFFRAFQAQNTVSTFDTSTTYRSTPINVPDVSPRVPLLGVVTDAMGQDEFVTIPFFAVDRVNLAGPTDLTTQPADTPNVQTISPITGQEVDTYYGCWLDMNQPTLLFPQFAKPGDFDNQTGYFNSPGFAIQSINAAFTRASHQCLIAEIAFDDVPIPPNADTSTSDKLAQRNLAYIDGPNPGANDSRRMPQPFQIQASTKLTQHVDELMFAWGKTPSGSTASIYLPGVTAAEILALADGLYPYHTLSAQDPYTITTPTGPVTFVPIPRNTGLLAGLLTIDLPPGVRDRDLYTVVVRQLTDATTLRRGGSFTNNPGRDLQTRVDRQTLSWRRVLGAFQINLRIRTKPELLPPEEDRLALFRWIAENVLPQNRWYPVMQRYIAQLAGRVAGFGGDPGSILPSPAGNVPGAQPGGEVDNRHEVTGKVSGLVFDHFGDFEGFVVETRLGQFRRFHSREHRVCEIVQKAMEDRIWVTVRHEPDRHEELRSIVLRVSPPERE